MPLIEHWSQEQLDALPEKNGFRQRGMDMTRLETFTDAAFAFAVTLLVVGGGDSVPANFAEMSRAMEQVPAFAASFANIMVFWYAHHIWSRRFGLEDFRSVLLSMLLVFVVLVYVYPLKAIYSGAIQWFTGGYIGSYFPIESEDDLRILLSIFGIGYCALSAMMLFLNRHALSRRKQLGLSDVEAFDTVSEVQSWMISSTISLGSVLLALFLRDGLVALAGLFYFVFFIALPVQAFRRDRKRNQLLAAADSDID